MGQRQAGHLCYARGQCAVGQWAQPRGSGSGPGRQQGERAGGFCAVGRQQSEGIGTIDARVPRQQFALAFFGQEIVEVPLHRALSGAVHQQVWLQGQVRAQWVGVWRGEPSRVVLKRPEPVDLVQPSNHLVIDGGLQQTMVAGHVLCFRALGAGSAPANSSGRSAIRRMPNPVNT